MPHYRRDGVATRTATVNSWLAPRWWNQPHLTHDKEVSARAAGANALQPMHRARYDARPQLIRPARADNADRSVEVVGRRVCIACVPVRCCSSRPRRERTDQYTDLAERKSEFGKKRYGTRIRPINTQITGICNAYNPMQILPTDGTCCLGATSLHAGNTTRSLITTERMSRRYIR